MHACPALSLVLWFRRFLTGFAFFAAGGMASAQTLPPARPPTAAEGAPVTLSVFEVTGERDLGYAASTAMSGTRTNEKLENLPNSVSVMTQEFLQDLAFNSYFDAVDFGMSS